MKRFICLIAAIALIIGYAGFAHAFTFDAKNMTAAVEYQNLDKELDSVDSSASYGESWTDTDDGDSTWAYSIGGDIAYEINDMNMKGLTANIGYNLSDTFKPYILLGTTDLEFTQKLSGTYVENDEGDLDGGSMDLLQSRFDSQMFTYGFGAAGNLLDFSKTDEAGVSDGLGIKVGYDFRYFMGSNSDNTTMVVLPNDKEEMVFDNETDVDFNEMDISLMASKAFKMTKFVKEITPMIGYKYSKVNMTVKNNVSIPIDYRERSRGVYQEGANVSEEQTLTSGTHNALLGISAKVNESWSASVGAVVGPDNGWVAKVTYAF